MKSSQNGNVLFLILIAVVLFAALSYAVTQSSRGSGNASKEKLSLDIAALNNQIASLRTAYTRTYISEGTIPLLSTNSGELHDPDGGVPILHPPLTLKNSGLSENVFVYQAVQTRYTLDGGEVGSGEEDLYLYVTGINEEACQLINKTYWGDETIPVANLNAGPTGAWSYIRRDNTEAITVANVTIELNGISEGCYDDVSWGLYSLYISVMER